METWPPEARTTFLRYKNAGLSPAQAARQILKDGVVTAPVPEATFRNWPKIAQREEALAAKIASVKFGDTPNVDNKPTECSQSIVLAIPDLHCPWEHPDALEFLKAVKTKYQPTVIVNMGDEVDFYGMSRFDHGPDMPSPGSELSLAVKHLIPFYREFPNSLVCQSNHTHRVHAKAKKAGMPSGTIKSIEEILHCPEGWVYKRAHKVDGVVYKHGTGKSGPNAHINHAKAISQSCAIGHIHAYGGVNYLKPGMFAANFACLIDKYAECFSYAEEMDDNIVLGCGIVKNGVEAHFIPMHVDDNNRWAGTL